MRVMVLRASRSNHSQLFKSTECVENALEKFVERKVP